MFSTDTIIPSKGKSRPAIEIVSAYLYLGLIETAGLGKRPFCMYCMEYKKFRCWSSFWPKEIDQIRDEKCNETKKMSVFFFSRGDRYSIKLGRSSGPFLSILIIIKLYWVSLSFSALFPWDEQKPKRRLTFCLKTSQRDLNEETAILNGSIDACFYDLRESERKRAFVGKFIHASIE